jgi:hypothetical protein
MESVRAVECAMDIYGLSLPVTLFLWAVVS